MRAVILLCLVGWALSLPAAPAPVSIKLGMPEVVLTNGQFGLKYFPDERLAVVRTEPDCRVLMAATVSSFLLEGPALGKFTSAKEVLGKGGAGEFDNGYAGISSAWRAPAGELLAIYHAEDQEGTKHNDAGIPGFYCRVALAVSRDDGATFEKRGPILSGQLAKVAGGRFDQGVGEPCLVAEPGGKFLYCYYTSHEPIDERGVTICLARCPIGEAMNTNAWLKFYRGGFTEPGLGGRDIPVVTSGASETNTLFPNVTYITARRQFVMLFCLNAWREGGQPERSGFYAAFSDDGIHWPREQMQQFWKVPTIPALGRELAWHPTLILDETVKAAEIKGWLYYSYSESWGHRPPNAPHYLMRRPIVITSKRPPKP